MILTCPACATQYRLKDGAIPPEGRQVRCAACKHKWHEEGAAASEADPDSAGASDAASLGGPPMPDPRGVEETSASIPAAAAREQMIAETPEPAIEPEPGHARDSFPPTQEDFSAQPHAEPAPTPADGTPPASAWDAPGDAEPNDEIGFAAIPAMHDDDDEPARGSLLGWIVGLVLLVIAATAAFYFFAPPELKARAGIAESGDSPLEVIITTRDRQRLASGNELLAISGRVVNLTDREQAIPPIRAELRDEKTNKLVYKWTIPPPARSLAPGAAASFNSAEVDVPPGAELLSLDFSS